MARAGGEDRGLFQRKGSNDWWIRWRCHLGHDHQEKAGNKSYARRLYNQRQTQKMQYGFCPMEPSAVRSVDEVQPIEMKPYGERIPRRTSSRARPKKDIVHTATRNTKPVSIANGLFEKIESFLTELDASPQLLRPCVYFLCKGDEIVYVGKSEVGVARIYQHLAQREKEFDRVFLWWQPANGLSLIESACIRYLKPRYNRSHHGDYSVADGLLLSNAISKSKDITQDGE